MLTRADKARLRRIAAACAELGEYGPLYACVESLMPPDAGFVQLMAGPPEKKRRFYLGKWLDGLWG